MATDEQWQDLYRQIALARSAIDGARRALEEASESLRRRLPAQPEEGKASAPGSDPVSIKACNYKLSEPGSYCDLWLDHEHGSQKSHYSHGPRPELSSGYDMDVIPLTQLQHYLVRTGIVS